MRLNSFMLVGIRNLDVVYSLEKAFTIFVDCRWCGFSTVFVSGECHFSAGNSRIFGESIWRTPFDFISDNLADSSTTKRTKSRIKSEFECQLGMLQADRSGSVEVLEINAM